MIKLPDLGYGYDALEPYIDSQTMEIHHTKHHAAYLEKLNNALAQLPQWENKQIEDILVNIKDIPDNFRLTIQNNGGGHHNHLLFWESMKPGGAKEPDGRLAEAINSTFGSFNDFKAQLTEAALNRFGSGWGWLVKNGQSLEVYSTANQDSPLMEGRTPLLGVDVWEHAYYLKYQNRRPEYLEAWWHTVNWDVIASRLDSKQ